MPQCSRLILSHNKISEIEPGAFSDLPSLSRLMINGNQLHNITADMFEGLAVLTELYLNNNKLVGIDSGVLAELPRPLSLSLNLGIEEDANMLQCDSDLCWLKQEENAGSITWSRHGYPPVCANAVNWTTWVCQGK